MESRTIVVLEGDDTGQELLEASLRLLDRDVIGLQTADLGGHVAGYR